MSANGEWVTLRTGQGPARVQVHPVAGAARGTLVLGHGAGGGTDAKDLQSLLTATAHGWHVGLVEQPWRVAGRKIATRPPTLDAAWRDVLAALLADDGPLPAAAGLPLVVGGRSAGARVACRTSAGDPEAGLARADGVLCLAFPLHPPGKPDKSRASELALPLGEHIPTLVVQGSADPFGSPAEVMEAVASEPGAATHLQVVEVPGNHSPSRDQPLVTSAALAWLDRLG
ncbi:alpha/beta hydrolase family protein [Ornithinimicrobium cryptoxanthini]|uniref:KANL3/Tex30 alpha/beta hydrolase-like domain-containing protein n=1 Tax=Ornithinimicrobium cryptoxanthini TaxID=2934161 RepID=A0ABY4YKB4_9MICO|nr:alpha/beta family hydrolase [Ornithinimicrobium cryptoxanthini]USQ77153.1 hypothetical protein NF557_04355 [Ornithinimicrobium cryptoxanthini]